MTRIVIGETDFDGGDRSMLDVLQLVEREAREEYTDDCCTIASSLDSCVRQTVISLWPSRIRTFVPLLASRRVRECIRAGHCPSPPNEG